MYLLSIHYHNMSITKCTWSSPSSTTIKILQTQAKLRTALVLLDPGHLVANTTMKIMQTKAELGAAPQFYRPENRLVLEDGRYMVPANLINMHKLNRHSPSNSAFQYRFGHYHRGCSLLVKECHEKLVNQIQGIKI